MLVDYHCHLAPDDERLGPRWMTEEWIAVYAAAAAEHGVGRAGADRALPPLPAGSGHLAARLLERDGARRPRRLRRRARGSAVTRACRSAPASSSTGWATMRSLRSRGLVADRDLDIVLGSVHWLAGGMVDHPGYSIWAVALGRRRVAPVLRGAASCGAVGAVRRDGAPRSAEGVRRPAASGGVPQREYDDTADAFAAAGVACEISSAGLRKAAARAVPGSRVPRRLRHARECRSRSPPTATGPRTSGAGSTHALRLATTPATAR